MASTYQAYFGTNYAPTAEELVDLKALVSVSETELEGVDSELAQLQEPVRVLQERRTEVRTNLDGHKALLSPVRRVNNDILEEIFLLCLPKDRNPCIIGTEAPLLLTRICNDLRRIAHSLPSLWTGIHIVLPSVPNELRGQEVEDEKKFMQKQLKLLHEIATGWLNRSGTCPLSISILQAPVDGGWMEGMGDFPGIEQELYIPFLERFLVPYSDRLRVIDVFLPPRVMEVIFGNRIQRMPQLKEFHVIADLAHVPYPTDLQTVGQTHLADSTCVTKFLSSSLTKVTLNGIKFLPGDLQSLLSPIIWRNVTDLNLSSFQNFGTVAQYVIKHCTAVKKLALTMNDSWYDADSPWPHTGRIVLPDLTEPSICLGSRPVDHEEAFVRNLVAPSLKILDVQSAEANSLRLLLTSVGDTLQSFTLHSAFFLQFGENLTEYLQKTPNLRSLKITFSNLYQSNKRWVKATRPTHRFQFDRHDYLDVDNSIGDDFLRALSPEGKNYKDILCPQLEVLDISPKLRTGVSEIELKKFVKARRAANRVDPRIADIKQLCIYVVKFRDTARDDEDVVPLGENSAVYFRKKIKIALPYSPMEGFVERGGYSPDGEGDRMDVYNYL